MDNEPWSFGEPSGVSRRVVAATRRLTPLGSPTSGYSEDFLRLQAQTPAWVLQAIAHRQVRVSLALGTVHRLQEEVAEFEPLIALRLRARLGKYQLQLIAGAEQQLGPRFRADA